MKVYLDNAATTKLDKRVLEKMKPYFEDKYGNASSIHFRGQENDLKITSCKKDISEIINGKDGKIVFTSSATEANNMIIKGVMRANKDKGRHFLISDIEHSCVKASARELLDEGFSFDYIPVDKNGLVVLKDLEKLLKPDTVLVSMMAVNNEIGSVQAIDKIGEICQKKGVYFHSDAVQAVPFLDIDVNRSNIDFLSLSAHKFYGPQGVGLAYINKNIKIKPLIVGGGQEDGLRAGTYNMSGIVGFTEALKLAYRERKSYIKKTRELRNYFWEKVKKEIPDVFLNGNLKNRTSNNLNLMFKGVEGEAILMDLSLKGICVSTGSACSAQNLKTSSVIRAIGIGEEYMNSNIRFSFGKYNNKKEIDYVLKELKKTVKRLRSFSSIKDF